MRPLAALALVLVPAAATAEDLRPRPSDVGKAIDRGLAEEGAGLRRIRAVTGQRPVKQDDVGSQSREVGGYIVVGVLGAADRQTEDQAGPEG